MIARQISVVDASIYMQASEDVQEWESKQELDSETIVIMGIIAFCILLFGVCIGAFIVIKCKRLHAFIEVNKVPVTPEHDADIPAQ